MPDNVGYGKESKPKANKSEKRIKKLDKWFSLAETAHIKWSKNAKRDLDFYLGNQWDADDLEKLRSQSRPALTFNRIKTPVNLVSGYERQNRRDIKVLPVKGASRTVAEGLTQLIRGIMENKNGNYEKSHAFLKGLITSRGWLKINLDFNEDIIRGDLVIEEVSPFRVLPDPFFEKYDMRDGMFIFVEAWLPKDKIENTFPDKKKDLETLNVNERDRQSIDYGSEYRDAQGSIEFESITEYKYRVKECWWIENKKAKFLVNARNSQVVNVTDAKNQKRIKDIVKSNETFRLIERTQSVLHLSTYVGNVMLQDIEDPFNGITDFPIIGYFAYFIEGEWRSLITDLQTPQQEINKRRSQLLHHLNQSANSGWMGDEDAVDDWDAVSSFGSKPGVIIKIRKGKNLQRIEPTHLSEGHLILAQQADNDIKIITGINADLLGFASEHKESGVAMEARRRQGNIVIESLFDNLRLSDKILGKRLVDFIQRSGAYSQEEMLRIVMDGKEQDVKFNQRETNSFGVVQRIQNDLSIGKFDIVISSAPNTPTARIHRLYSLLEVLRAGIPIPPDIILDQMDIPRKEEILKRMQEQSKGQVPKEVLEAQVKQQELQLNAAIEREKIAVDAQIKREEIAMRRWVEVQKIKSKNPTFTV